jgi:cobalt-zinc-cadmium efflux system protein
VSRTRRLTVVLALNLALVGSLIVVGVAAHSVGVLAAGGDYLLDAAGVGVALLAIRLSARSPSPARPRGYPNVADVAALINAGWLLLLELIVAGVAADRLVSGTSRVDGLAVLIVSGIAALAMALGAVVLHGDADDAHGDHEPDLPVAAVMLDTVADAAAAAGVAAAGAIILATGGWYWLDPAVALVIAAIVGYHAVRLMLKARAHLRSGPSDAGRGPSDAGRR